MRYPSPSWASPAGFIRLGEGERWSEDGIMQRYEDILPNQPLGDMRPLMEACPGLCRVHVSPLGGEFPQY